MTPNRRLAASREHPPSSGANLRSRPIVPSASDLEFHPGADYFTRGLGRRGGAELRLGFAGLAFLLEGLAPEDVAVVRRRYGIFVREGESLPDEARIEVLEADVPAFLRPAQTPGGSPELYRLRQFLEAGRLFAYSYEFAGWYDPAAGRGQLALVRCRTERLHRALENFLRTVTAHRALERGGFLLHGAGVVRRGRAHVFFGPSGSGKTTVTLLSEGDRDLGDDLVLIQEGERGYEVCPVPFRGVFREAPADDSSVPLGGLYRLVQAPADLLEPLAPARGAAEVMGSLPFVMEGGSRARALEVVGRAVAAVPVCRLHFRKSPDFWKLLEGR